MCLHAQNQEPCNHPECLLYSPNHPYSHAFGQKDRLLESLIALLVSRNALIASLSASAKKIIDQVTELEQAKKFLAQEKQDPTHLLASEASFPYHMRLIGETPNSVLKEKGFDLHLEVYDEAEVRFLDEKLFKIKLFTNESPPKPLKHNIASKKILRGTLESCMDGNGRVHFENIVINEVSSHYINESFTMVISSENTNIKPFVIENLYVRARNSNKRSNN